MPHLRLIVLEYFEMLFSIDFSRSSKLESSELCSKSKTLSEQDVILDIQKEKG